MSNDRNSSVLQQNYSGFIRIKVYNRRFIFKINESTDIAVVKNLVTKTIQEITKCSKYETESIFDGLLKYLKKNRI